MQVSSAAAVGRSIATTDTFAIAIASKATTALATTATVEFAAGMATD